MPGSDLYTGSLDLLILKAVSWGPLHGYAIGRWIRQSTEEVLAIQEGALYPALHRLERRGLLAEEWGTSETNREAKFYRLTPGGGGQARGGLPRGRSSARVRTAALAAARPGEEHAMKRVFHWSRGPDDASEEVRREIEQHLELRACEFEAQGMSPEAARRAALEAFGDRRAIESEVRDMRGTTLRERERRDRLGALAQDVRFALRGLVRSPGFTAVALLTLALGIGANSAIFGVVRSGLLRPLPYPRPGRRVRLWSDIRGKGRATPEWLTPPQFLDWQAQNHSFTAMAGYQRWAPDLTGDGEPESLSGLATSWNFLDVLGVPVALGRGFQPADDDPGAERVVILSDGLWRRRFGADSHVLGRVIQLNAEPWTVIGVLPAGFRSPVPSDVWRPTRRPADSRCGRGCIVVRAIGRLKPGVSLDQARADLGAIQERLRRAAPETDAGIGAWPIALHEQLTGPARPGLLALSGAVLFVLLIGCVNLANLLLLRGAARARELSVRAALGAGRGRLLRQLLTESLVLAVRSE